MLGTKLNKYKRWYDQLINYSSDRKNGDERHHIVPQSLGGNNAPSNLVWLTYREHYLAHWLLTKFTDGYDRIKMQWALSYMGCRRNQNSPSWRYDVARRAAHLARSSPEHQERMRQSALEQWGSEETRERLLRGQDNNRIPHSGETLIKIGNIRRGKTHSPEAKAKMSRAKKGKPGPKHSEEAKEKIRKYSLTRARKAGTWT